MAPRHPLEPERLLRRVHLTLQGQPPTDADVAALAAASTDEAKRALIERHIDEGLSSPAFYDQTVGFGHQWIRNGSAINGTTGDAYMGNESVHLLVCGATSAHPGAFTDDGDNCTDASAATLDLEPWWAPGTTVRLVGDAANTAPTVTDDSGTHDCGIATEIYYNMGNRDGCGCGPHATWCYPRIALNAGGDREGSQRRDLWDEPARLVAHLIWHDRPLSDVVLGNYTVATTELAAWYLRSARQTGLYNEALDANDTWFRPEVGAAPRDPNHPMPTDPRAWRELVVETVAPHFLSLNGGTATGDPTRTLRWNPVDNPGPAPGLPSAGVMTMPGMNSYFPRERVRAARFVEIFSCRSFDPPPPDQHFPPVGRDLATSGPCMHCHVLMDPVAIAFRRMIFRGNYVPRMRLAALGNLRVPTDLFMPGLEHTHRYWFKSGANRWQVEWASNTVMTPVAQEVLDANPEALFYDTIPPEYSIFGEHPDGTMGPLAFAKVLVSSGEFDRCAVRRIYQHFVGRELNPETESRYIQELTDEFVAGGRSVRPLLRSLLTSEVFGSEPAAEEPSPEPAEPTEASTLCAANDNDLIRLGLAPTCAGCHGEGTSRPFFASLSAFEDLLAYNPQFVVAGAPDESELLRLLDGTSSGAYPQMPTVGDPFADLAGRGASALSMEDLRDWVTDLEAPTGPAAADRRASATRRLRTPEYINVLQMALGQEPGGGQEPLLQTRGIPPLDPDLANAQAYYMNSRRHQIYMMSGGANYLRQRLPEEDWSATSLVTVTQLAQGACVRALESRDSVLLRHASLTDTLPDAEAAIRQNIGYLFGRFLHQTPTAEDVELLFAGVYQPAEATSTRIAWTQVCSALARDPLFITY